MRAARLRVQLHSGFCPSAASRRALRQCRNEQRAPCAIAHCDGPVDRGDCRPTRRRGPPSRIWRVHHAKTVTKAHRLAYVCVRVRTCACARDARGMRAGCVYAHVHVQRARPACLRARVICFGVCTYVSVTPSPTRKPTAPATHAPSGPMSKECQQVPPYLTKPGANHCIPLGMVPQCAASIVMRKRLAQSCIRRDMVSLTARSDGELDCTTPFAPAQDTLPAAPFQCRCATSTKSHKASRMLNAASPLSPLVHHARDARRCDAARTRAAAPTGLAWDWAAGL